MLYQISPTGQITGGGVEPLSGIPALINFVVDSLQIENAQVIPVQPVASQQFEVTLSEQACTLKLYFKDVQIAAATEIPTEPPVFEALEVLFMDIYLNDALLLGGVRCMDRNPIIRDLYFGFIGDFSVVDLQGTDDPLIAGFGARWQLAYWPGLS